MSLLLSPRALLDEGKATIPCLAERLTTELIAHICVSRPHVLSEGSLAPTVHSAGQVLYPELSRLLGTHRAVFAVGDSSKRPWWGTLLPHTADVGGTLAVSPSVLGFDCGYP